MLKGETEMKRLALWSAILAVAVLAVGTAAQAATVDLTLAFSKTTNIAVNEVLTWTLTAVVSGNSYALDGGPTVNAGFEAMSVGVSSTANIARFQEGSGPPPLRLPSGKPDAAIYNTQAPPTGFGPPSLSITTAYIANGGMSPVYLNLPLQSGTAGWNAEWTDLKPELKVGNAAVGAVTYASGTIKATATGSSEYLPFVEYVSGTGYNLLVYTVDSTTWEISQRPLNNTTDILHLHGATLTVGVTNQPPTVGTISPAAILEADWTKEPGWNNLAHKVIPDIKVTGSSDPDSDPLTYDWTISKPGGGSKVLSVHGDTIVGLSLSELASLGLPDWTGPGGAYLWQLSVVANDGKGGVSSPSASIDVFVPEPATIGLLGFGIIGLLRRRRA